LTETALARLDTAKRVLARTRNVKEVLEVRSASIAVEAFAKARGDRQLWEKACEVRFLSERKAGDYLRGMGELRGGSKFRNGTLKELGLEKKESHFWKWLANLSQEQFEWFLSEFKERSARAWKQIASDLEKELARANPVPIKGPSTPWLRLEQGDFREKTVADDSVDFVLTDPPYGEEFLELWDGLGQVAARVLKPGGWLISYSGQAHLPRVLAQLSANLQYHWTLALHLTWHQVFRGVWVEWKPILAFYKPPFNETKFADFIEGAGPEKQNHDWAQNHNEAVKLIEIFTQPGQVVMDPMVGSGSTIEACVETKRNCIAFEKDTKTFQFLEKRFPNGHYS